MELFKQSCKTCGGNLLKWDEQFFKCKSCGNLYTYDEAKKYVDTLRSLLDDAKLEAVSNARRNLYQAITAEYVSSAHVHENCVILKNLLPDDFQANFYETVIGNNGGEITRAIYGIDVAENACYMETAVRFLIRSLQSEYVLATGDLIERVYKATDLIKYEQFSTALSEEAQKLDDCIYMTTYPRDVFVAYSSKDMAYVAELVECLEEQGLSCFVAARNLRHGKGAVENYEHALQEAMDNCTSFVFVSTPNSRHPGCDALKKEIPYIKQKDVEAAPPEYRNDYTRMPHKYKKHRVEYRVRESVRLMAADRIVAEFFDGYERVYSPDEVAERVMNAGMEYEEPVMEEISTPIGKVKYCVECQTECPDTSKFCLECGGKQFAGSLAEIELLKKIAMLENERKEAVAQAERAERERLEKERAEEERAEKDRAEKERAEQERAEKEQAEEEYLESTSSPEEYEPSITDDNGYTICRGKFEVEYPSQLVQVRIPDGETEIKVRAFHGCNNIVAISIPSSVTKIDDFAFCGCSSLTAITIPDSVKSIGCYAFQGCTSLTSISIPDSVTSVGHLAFSNCSRLAEVNMSKNLTCIDNALFKDCQSLTAVTIPDGVTSLKESVFSGCTGLTSVTIPNSVKSIGQNAFWGCTGLTSIDIPRDVTSINFGVFHGCTGLTAVTIPEYVKSIGQSAFYGCKSLKSIAIPKYVTDIGVDAFWGCIGLKSISIPEGVKCISRGMFRGCVGLTSVNIPKSAKSIDENAFYGCIQLTSAVIPEGVTSIGRNAFGGCSALTTITIPSSMTSIEVRAFAECHRLKKMTFANPRNWKKGYGFFDAVPVLNLSNPEKAARALVHTYVSQKLTHT